MDPDKPHNAFVLACVLSEFAAQIQVCEASNRHGQTEQLDDGVKGARDSGVSTRALNGQMFCWFAFTPTSKRVSSNREP